ncbi:MAG: nicotinate-nucleotide adenylyltransferase [Clostridiales bacterium]|jgi:nicotinate-nucleotide adenylyltransferase|nr:nicotinate-nucleotide adenylyltransferase [Clostridiales bacterium]
MKKVGIMGGTFNPIHNGHLFLAEHAYEQAGLDYILFMPTMNPPHKAGISVESAEHRINMVRLAIKDNPHFLISDIELQRPGITYTSDTLIALKESEPDTEYYFIVGADSLMMMSRWMDPQTVFRLSTIVAGGREQSTQEQLEEQARYLENEYKGKIILLDMPIMELSSEKIRERRSKGKSIRYYLPDEVISYINKHDLYK